MHVLAIQLRISTKIKNDDRLHDIDYTEPRKHSRATKNEHRPQKLLLHTYIPYIGKPYTIYTYIQV